MKSSLTSIISSPRMIYKCCVSSPIWVGNFPVEFDIPVNLSPSFNHKYRDCCFRQVSSSLASCLISTLRYIICVFPPWNYNLPSVAFSVSSSSSKALLTLISTLPKPSLFYLVMVHQFLCKNVAWGASNTITLFSSL